MSEPIPHLDEIPTRLARLHETVLAATQRAGRAEGAVVVELAVKYQGADRIAAALGAGGFLLGHNLIQQLEAAELALRATGAPTHRTHVIGHVQKNKAAKALAFAQCIETLDSLPLAERLNRLHGERDASEPFDVMLQVNSSGAESQYGLDPAEVVDFAGAVNELPHLRIIGLMTIGAHTDHVTEIARSFTTTRELRDSLLASGIASATQLSMGMTHDLDIAIAEGSTIIRVGTAVFGPRP